MSQGSGRAWPALCGGALGALAALGQAPVDLPVLTVLALGAVFWLFARAVHPRRAAWLGWAFGTGYGLVALHWIVSPFLVDAPRHGWMAPFALLLMAAGLGLFWALAFAVARWLVPGRGGAWALALCWAAAELARAYLFTGFPWAMFAQTLVGSWAGQGLAWIGPHGMGLVMLGGAAALGTALHGAGRPARAFGAALGLLVIAAVLLPAGWLAPPPAPLTAQTLRLVQPNAPQDEKWDPARIPVFYDRQLRLTAAPSQLPDRSPDLVLWPETAIPWSLPHAAPVLEEIAAAAGGVPVGLGVQRSAGLRFYNSMVVLGPQGQQRQRYDKHHLVPFGEYMPFGDLLARFGIHGLAATEGMGFSAGPGPALLDFGALGKALPLICYEAVFAHDVGAAPARPAFLLQITNDAWFGKGAGPRQHLAQARMRAIEQGLPLARVANTGISAMIDPRGRILEALPLNAAGYLDVPLPAPAAPTLYARSGDLPVLLLVLAGLAAALAARGRAAAAARS